jgi:hypothetical protein
VKRQNIDFEWSTKEIKKQNETVERASSLLTQKVRCIRITVNLLENFYLECYFAVMHLLNRTLIKNLNWKSLNICLNRALKKSYNLIIEILYLKIYDCKICSLLKDKDAFFKSEKLKSRAFVDYLIEYNSSNIFRVWNLETWTISDYKDVIFDED